METADAVVVGAGPNGLVAANLLADAGWEVLVLEAAATPGGAARSAELAAPGFLTELGSAFHPLGVASPVLRRLDLAAEGLRWRHAPAVLGHGFADGRAVVQYRDPATTAESVGRFAAADADRWLAAYQRWRSISPRLLDALFTPFPPVRAGGSLLRQVGAGDALRLTRQLLLSARRLGEELFDGEGARALLAGCALHTDLTLSEPGGGGYGWLLAMLGQEYGFPVPAGGAQRLTAALTGRLRSRGGRLLCGVSVDRIAVAGGRALGVRSATGEWWRARRAVVADVPAPVLYADLVGWEKLPARLRADLAGFQWDQPTLKIDWALTAPVPWRAPELSAAGVVHLGGGLDDLSRYAASLARGEPPATPFLVAGQLTTADPARSPAGTESFWCYTHLPRAAARGSSAGGSSAAGSSAAGELVREQLARVEALLEQQAPGFGRLVAGRQVSGPAELARQNPSLVGGALGGGTAALYQQLVLRPVPGLGRSDTPIDRLYLASSSAHPGPGVHGGPGANAARAALARSRPGVGALYGAGVRAAHRTLYPR
ncbi:NAD(P)/FAD-dependent oxidoreductase [Natronosporangium hydrolyticum]|uniref:NAD(P)/FAD-dependent oxidoreductase n=1 Tax=Natronosporangium hydrolyticum TaxID=2811111 RepID=A0A895YAN5_9ACTN|nr:NAD(P)/FAD-dependent oxidoreductase [Natronosporangium hydrolyticum]QSB13355.1 NAD(P)/FAD-dependent oxidoreductase [Natronosporangium hydrolyticum]